MNDSKFATAINCMDGRVQKPLTEWIQKRYQVEYVDMITEAGPDRVLLDAALDQLEIIKTKARISAEKHNSKVMVIAGHHDCAGNPVSAAEHKRMIGEAVEQVNTWNLGVEVTGVWINSDWQVEPLDQ
jgi:hypothetical protein